MLRCRAVQAKLTAYIHGELPLKARRRVAAHLEHCPRCQSAYQRERELVHELERELPRVGQGHKTELARVWSKVQREIYAPETPRPTLHYRASYGVAALMLMLAMVVPYALSRGDNAVVPSRTLPARVV
ncbi:MAG: zf-HC2 domain-containing protein, partial [Anaerolineae bacterium]